MVDLHPTNCSGRRLVSVVARGWLADHHIRKENIQCTSVRRMLSTDGPGADMHVNGPSSVSE